MGQPCKIIFTVTTSEAKNIIAGLQHTLFTWFQKCEEGETSAYLYNPDLGVFGECRLDEQKRVQATLTQLLEVKGSETLVRGSYHYDEGYIWNIIQFSKFEQPLKLSDLHLKKIPGPWQYLSHADER